jgi:hypothetical protein
VNKLLIIVVFFLFLEIRSNEDTSFSSNCKKNYLLIEITFQMQGLIQVEVSDLSSCEFYTFDILNHFPLKLQICSICDYD